MKIAKLETFTNQYVGFVRVTADTGDTGWGQVSTYHADITCQVFHRQVARHALGQPAYDFDDLLDRITEREHKFPGSYLRRAMSGLDTALWDLRGRVEGKPVASLIGGSPGKVRAYASSMKRDITPEDEAARFVKLRDAHGFDAFKWRVGAEVRPRSGRVAGAHRGSHPGCVQGTGRRRRQAGRRQFMLLACPRHRGGTDAGRQRHRPLRGAVSLTGNRNRRSRSRRP
jgi:L-alanine-DL-glutamate epimerase-like enolase superfamily enzyme